MNLRKALKEKNKVAGNLNHLFHRMRENNITEDGQSRPYNSKEVLSEINQEIDQLVELKVKLQLANTPILNDIYRVAELKVLIRQLRYMECNDSRKISSGIITYHIATIKADERDQLIKSLEEEIEAIHERIDAFNFRTSL
jgi:sugar-specific transcriptional regulator TrmB